MLCLSRKIGEEIYINVPGYPRIRVMVCGVSQERGVQLGIDAPRAVTVHRREIQEEIDRESGVSTS